VQAQGRGAGQTTTSQIIGELYGGEAKRIAAEARKQNERTASETGGKFPSSFGTQKMVRDRRRSSKQRWLDPRAAGGQGEEIAAMGCSGHAVWPLFEFYSHGSKYRNPASQPHRAPQLRPKTNQITYPVNWVCQVNHRSQGTRTDLLRDNITKLRGKDGNQGGGTSAAYLLRRIARDHPDIRNTGGKRQGDNITLPNRGTSSRYILARLAPLPTTTVLPRPPSHSPYRQ
jgi:hypothetical protein